MNECEQNQESIYTLLIETVAFKTKIMLQLRAGKGTFNGMAT